MSDENKPRARGRVNPSDMLPAASASVAAPGFRPTEPTNRFAESFSTPGISAYAPGFRATVPSGKFADRFVGKTSAPKPEDVASWFSALQRKEFEADGGASPIAPYLTGSANSLWDQVKGGARLAGEKIGQSASGLGATLGVPGMEDRRKQYDQRVGAVNTWLERDPNAPDSALGTIGQQLGNVAAFLPELYNPASVSKYATPLNIAYHTMMGYAPSQSKMDAAFSGGSHPLGETIENVLSKGRGVPGQPVGVALEKVLPGALDWFSQPAQAPSASYIPIRP